MKKQQKTIALWVVLILIVVFMAKVLEQEHSPIKNITYSEFVKHIENANIKDVTFQGKDTILGKFVEGYDNGSDFKLTGNTGEQTYKILGKANIIPNYKKAEQQGLFQTLLVTIVPYIILFVLFLFLLKQLQAGGGKAMSFGKSKAKLLNENDKKVTFSDVSGVEEAKNELVEVVDFLKDPKKYTVLGGKIPKGVLLIGPPGTGKTLLARAVAGEAGVPFLSISGSDFVEMFVGVGASRVRDLFNQGKKFAPCIIFIDEIDAVGRHRGGGMGGGHDEREQTLNQMLVEMDGFESNEGVIIMAATNRVDVLDPALLRPGRFDRRVTVGRPDVRGRHGILKVHTNKTPLADDVKLADIAKGTPGFTGADLANLVNEAALIAARGNKKKVFNIDFESAKDKVLMGVERRSMVISDHEKKNTAYHEAGHTIVGMLLPHTDPIHKVSIIPRGGALGVTQTLPNEDMLSLSKERAHNMIAFLMGGRVAEEMVFNDYTNGASNDIERATEIARNMVCTWGMSDTLGPINFSTGKGSPFYGGGGAADGSQVSEETSQKIDNEISKIVKQNYETARRILTENRDFLTNLSESLILWETLDAKQISRIQKGETLEERVITDDDSNSKPKMKDDDSKGESSSGLLGSDPDLSPA